MLFAEWFQVFVIGVLRKSIWVMNYFRRSMTGLVTAFVTEISFLVNCDVARNFFPGDFDRLLGLSLWF